MVFRADSGIFGGKLWEMGWILTCNFPSSVLEYVRLTRVEHWSGPKGPLFYCRR